MLRWVKAARPLNLFIVFVTQYLFYTQNFDLGDKDALVLAHTLLLPFIIVTTLITASGYYINDYFDFASDLVNKKKRMESKSAYLFLYTITVLLGYGIAIRVAYQVGNMYLSTIYIIAVAILFIYSAILKSKGLVGNITVAMFSASVILIILFAERQYLVEMDTDHNILCKGILLSAFIFFISLVREIIKDIEDINGDKSVGYNTFPISAGVDRAKVLCAINLVFFLMIFIFSIFSMVDDYRVLLSCFLMIVLPSLLAIFLILRGASQKDFRRLSIYFKIMMLSGLFLFFFVL